MASNSLSFTQAKRIYKSESGYRVLNQYLIRRVHGRNTGTYGHRNLMVDPSVEEIEGYPAAEIIAELTRGMRPAEGVEVYHRGAGPSEARSYRSETFLSMSRDREQAKAYLEDDQLGCCLFHVTVDPEVRRLEYQEESEVVLEPGCVWELQGPRASEEDLTEYSVRVRAPRASHASPVGATERFPWRGSPIPAVASRPPSPPLPHDAIQEAYDTLIGLSDEVPTLDALKEELQMMGLNATTPSHERQLQSFLSQQQGGRAKNLRIRRPFTRKPTTTRHYRSHVVRLARSSRYCKSIKGTTRKGTTRKGTTRKGTTRRKRSHRTRHAPRK